MTDFTRQNLRDRIVAAWDKWLDNYWYSRRCWGCNCHDPHSHHLTYWGKRRWTGGK